MHEHRGTIRGSVVRLDNAPYIGERFHARHVRVAVNCARGKLAIPKEFPIAPGRTRFRDGRASTFLYLFSNFQPRTRTGTRSDPESRHESGEVGHAIQDVSQYRRFLIPWPMGRTGGRERARRVPRTLVTTKLDWKSNSQGIE